MLLAPLMWGDFNLRRFIAPLREERERRGGRSETDSSVRPSVVHPKGQFTDDVPKIIGIFNLTPLTLCHTQATYWYSLICFLAHPLPHSADVICECPRRATDGPRAFHDHSTLPPLPLSSLFASTAGNPFPCSGRSNNVSGQGIIGSADTPYTICDPLYNKLPCLISDIACTTRLPMERKPRTRASAAASAATAAAGPTYTAASSSSPAGGRAGNGGGVQREHSRSTT